jgi:predicted small lipoprotein YifL
VAPGAGLEGCGKLRPIGIRFPDRQVRSELQYQLQQTGPQQNRYATLNQSRNIPHETSDTVRNGAVQKLH